MYEPPIELIITQMQNEMKQKQETFILNAVQKTGVNVDKEELLKALKYDREQYNKGYIDGLKEFAERVPKYANPHYWTYGAEENYVIYGKDFEKLLKEMVGDK